MDYKVFRLSCPTEYIEIFVAELGDLGFDTMQELDEGIEAFSEDNSVTEEETDELLKRYQHLSVFGKWGIVENTNWNEEWEKNYEPVEISSQCIIRAEFHKIEQPYQYDIVINPRMSFGTGHHATTFLMTRALFDLNLEGKEILDAGCGTGVLGIVAEKRNANHILAYDVSNLCIENSIENAGRNQCKKIDFETGVTSEMDFSRSYDVILANINKNVLLDDAKYFSSLLKNNGRLLLSGFFIDDMPDIEAEYNRHNICLVTKYEKDGWACLLMKHKDS